MSNPPTIWVMPGGAFQLPLIAKMRARGLRIIASDRSENCPARAVVDEFVPLGVNDREALLARMRELKPDAIATDQTDVAVGTVAWLAEQLGVPGIGTRCAEIFTNKHRMREFAAARGFPVPQFHLCHSLEDGRKQAAVVGYPVVVKPIANQSSKGVNRVDTPEAFDAAFREAEEHGAGLGVLVEELIDGTEFTVEGFKDARRHHSLAISEKAHYAHRPMVACSLVYTPDSPRFDYEVLRRQNDAFVEAAGLPFGITHAEYKFAKGRFYMIEIAARGCGTRVTSDLVPRLSGIEVYEHYLDAVLGKDGDPGSVDPQISQMDADQKQTGEAGAVQPSGKSPSLSHPCPSVPSVVKSSGNLGKSGVLDFLLFPPGKVRAYEGVEEIKALSGIIDVVLNYPPGTLLPSPSDDTNRAGYFLAVTDTPEELATLRAVVRERVKVIHE